MNPKYITVHSSATQPTHKVTVDMIRQWHLQRGWKDIGYAYVITFDGVVHEGRPLDQVGAHVYGHNQDNIGICLVGGVNSKGQPEDNYSEFQKNNLRILVQELQWRYDIPDENVKGHRDWSPDLDGDGIVEPSEWLKACPCFDVKEFMKTIRGE